jgi:hypothetical protein
MVPRKVTFAKGRGEGGRGLTMSMGNDGCIQEEGLRIGGLRKGGGRGCADGGGIRSAKGAMNRDSFAATAAAPEKRGSQRR